MSLESPSPDGASWSGERHDEQHLMAQQLIELHDGRHAGVSGLGDPQGRRLIIMCHPSPGAGGFDPDPPATSTTGVRVIALDRPGYGASDPPPDLVDPLRTWLDDVDDYLSNVENIARSITGTRFGEIGVIGWGVGAVFASGLAARHPELVNRLALIEPTGGSCARRRAAGKHLRLDARLENADALQTHLGAPDRMRAMLDAAGLDPAGREFDARVVRRWDWPGALKQVRARTVIMSSDQSDGAWYRRRIRGARSFGQWGDPSTTIVAGWKNVLRFFTAES